MGDGAVGLVGAGGTGGETLIVRDGGREGTNWEERENN